MSRRERLFIDVMFVLCLLVITGLVVALGEWMGSKNESVYTESYRMALKESMKSSIYFSIGCACCFGLLL